MNAAKWNRVCMVLAFAGIFVAGYLSLSSILGLSIPCGSGSADCDAVEASIYSRFLGVPVAVFGLLAYMSLAGLSLARTMGRAQLKRRAITAGLAISGLGTLISFYLTYTAISVLNKTCIWCLASATIMTLSFLAHGFLSQQDQPAEPERRGNDRVFAIILAVLAFGAVGFRFANLKAAIAGAGWVDATQLPKTIDDMITKDGNVLGPKTAPVIIVEFGDLTCPHCRKSYQELTKVEDASNGKVRLVFRHFPLINNPEHKMSLVAAMVSQIAAEKGKFWNFLDQIYALEDATSLGADDIYKMAGNIGLDPAEVSKRVNAMDDSDPAFQKVHTDINLGLKLQIKTTPTFVIGISGGKPQSLGSADLDRVLSGEPYSKYVRGL